MGFGIYTLGYDVQWTKSHHARCCFCGEKITDEFRLRNHYANKYCHIHCSGFTFSKITEMLNWKNVVSGANKIKDMVRKN